MKSLAACMLTLAPLAAAVNPHLEFALGMLAECRGDAGSAAAHFENARLADPHAELLMKRGVSRLLESGDRSGAIALFREFAAARPGDSSTQLAYADFLVDQGKGDALALRLATETLAAALARNPGHPEIIRRLISLDRSRGADLLEQLAAADPPSVLLYAALARSLCDSEDAASAAEVDRRFRLALEAHPENAELARGASEFFRNSGRVDQAIEVLRRHTQAAPWSLDLRVRTGVLLFVVKRDAEAVAALNEVLAIHPHHALAHQALAKHFGRSGERKLALHHSAELLKIRGGSASGFLKLAAEQLNAGDARTARLLLEKAVFEHPENPDLRMKLALATHRDSETRTRAPRLFREAEAAFPDGGITDPAFLTASAEAMIEAGQSRAGEERLRAAIRAYPADAKKETAAALRRLAILWNTENRNADAARALLQRADALDPK